ncbi:hypothetical protein [Brevibacillus choshinensis]|uniref:hypothetical protein n=1 Tax=Brevibacillus choshinensis TaxID=54911 RepID=UPI002E1CF2AB|nr:hypothetical protein [Brevibacillus choshinensis]MED4752524.1 hypothetical protein [Brevibacillus choshinensis]MED4784988.1 hypothetical protein [Brevibacillus choshinensis]
MAYLVGLFFWLATLAYSVYRWFSIKPNYGFSEFSYLIAAGIGIYGTLLAFLYFFLVFWYYEQYKFMFIALGILGMMLLLLKGTVFLS